MSGPQKNARESMSCHLRDDPKLALAVFDFGSFVRTTIVGYLESTLYLRG